MDKLILFAKDLIDPATEIHYAYHKSLKDITIEHTHDFYELFLVTNGKAYHNINGKTEIIEEGTLVFIRPNDTHFYRRFDSENCEIINLAFPAYTITMLFNYFGEGFNKEKLLKQKHSPHLKLSKFETEILIARFEGLNVLSRGKKARIKTEFRILIAEIFSKYFAKIKKEVNEEAPLWLLKLRDEMEKKENFIAGINKMNEKGGKSAEHLSRSFKKFFKETPTDFINRLRLNFAANLLANSDETIVEISLIAGFENLSHFYHLFKKHFDASPKEFRSKHQKMIIPY